jgi:hypothetical protein
MHDDRRESLAARRRTHNERSSSFQLPGQSPFPIGLRASSSRESRRWECQKHRVASDRTRLSARHPLRRATAFNLPVFNILRVTPLNGIFCEHKPVSRRTKSNIFNILRARSENRVRMTPLARTSHNSFVSNILPVSPFNRIFCGHKQVSWPAKHNAFNILRIRSEKHVRTVLRPGTQMPSPATRTVIMARFRHARKDALWLSTRISTSSGLKS